MTFWECRPPVNRMTDACENITFPQLLFRAVISYVTHNEKKKESCLIPDYFIVQLTRSRPFIVWKMSSKSEGISFLEYLLPLLFIYFMR